MSAPKVFSLTDFGSKKGSDEAKVPVKKPAASNADVVSGMIIVDPTKDIDIDRIHEHVMRLYDKVCDEIKVAEQELRKLQKVVFTSIEERVMSESKILALELKIRQLEDEADKYEDYEEEAIRLIAEYLKMIPADRERVVGTEEVIIDSSLYSDFRCVVSEFISLAQQFATDIYIISQQTNVDKCRKCHGNQVLVGSKIHCSACGHVTNLKEGSGSANTVKNEYYRADTFEEHMAQYQGRQRKPIPPEVFQKIADHCKANGLEVAKLTKPQIFRILKKYKLSEYYNSLNSIAHSLTEAPLPDIRKYEKALLERHRLIEQEYMLIRDEEGRSNFLYGWYVLRAFLMMEGCKVNKEDFLTLTTRDALVDHDKLMIQLCARIRERQLTDSNIKGNWVFKGLA